MGRTCSTPPLRLPTSPSSPHSLGHTTEPSTTQLTPSRLSKPFPQHPSSTLPPQASTTPHLLHPPLPLRPPTPPPSSLPLASLSLSPSTPAPPSLPRPQPPRTCVDTTA